MGFDVNGTQFLLIAKASGVSFEQVAMIGRQKMHLLPQALESLMDKFGYSRNEAEVEQLLNQGARFAEPFLRALGAKEIYSFDTSSYESATYTYDMNDPIAESY